MIESATVKALAHKTVLVVGDLMLDRFVYGAVERISPEAPIPVMRFQRDSSMLGGAGNVARNIVALNGKTILIGTVGQDEDGKFLTETLCREFGIDARTVVAAAYPTILKTRFVSDGQQILRVDREQTSINQESLERTKSAVRQALPEADAMVLSDYSKGMLTPDCIRAHIEAAHAHNIPVIVDPKSRELSHYRGADIITPNAQEATAATGSDCTCDEGAASAAEIILSRGDIGAVLITRGSQGMTLLAPSGGIVRPIHIPTQASSVYDVSGAGDTVVATLSLAIAAGIDIKAAAQLANSAAGVVVGKLGTAAASAEEVLQSLEHTENQSLFTREHATNRIEEWRARGLTIGFANGCFDLVHPGHVALLKKARDQCDKLVVALNTDQSVKRLKGINRPIQDQTSRAAVIGSLRSVDLVTLFDEDTPLDLIKQFKPDVIIKGADYEIHEVVGHDIVETWGGRVCLIPLEAGHSTSSIIARSNA